MREEKHSNESKNNTLEEQDLEDVTGGFTIIDTCQNRWVPGICNAIWGKCPNLTMIVKESKHGLNAYTLYSVSCSKGCFADIEYKRRYERYQ